MTPRMEAICFMIWRVAEPAGWDVSIDQIAAEIGIAPQVVGRAVRRKGWQTRLRASKKEINRSASLDRQLLDGGCSWRIGE